MRYKKFLVGCLMCCGFLSLSDNHIIKADYFTDYNTTVLDSIMKPNIFDFDIFSKSSRYTPPEIKNSMYSENINEIDYNAELLSYKKNSYNYLIFYSLDDNNIPNELFRVPIVNSGDGKIVDKKLLKKLLKPNNTIIMNIMSFDIDDKGNIENLKHSPTSKEYYTKKTLNLVIKEGNKEVVNRIISLGNEAKDNKVLVYPYELEQYYRPDKYYSYTNEEIFVDGEQKEPNKLEVSYTAKKIEVNLSKNREYWKNVKIVYPTAYSKENTTYDVKKDTSLGEFLKEKALKEKFDSNNDYEFIGYYMNNKELKTVLKSKITDDIEINAKFKTKIILDNDENKKEVTLSTGDKLSGVDESFFDKPKYHVENYTIYSKKDNKKIKDIEKLNDEVADESVIIKANYKENTNIVSVRQDEYNKRFGKVDDSIKDKDIEWAQTKKIGELLTQLREKIKPNTGYQTFFRISKKIVNEEEYLTNDIVLEVYFKKIEEEWVTVKFVGKGIDKFLSDGQEVLANSRIDSMINLPTATGETSREFLGWQANRDYLIAGEGSNKHHVSKNTLLQTNELGAVVTEKGKDLEFTAVYRKLFNVEFEKTPVGSITLSKETENILVVDEFNSIGDATKNNKIIVVPRAGYSLSYFVADKNVKVNTGNGTKEIFSGQRIEEKDLYNIVPTTNLKITPVFKWTLSSGKLEDMIENNKIKTVEDALNLELESAENIRNILGPLYYLR